MSLRRWFLRMICIHLLLTTLAMGFSIRMVNERTGLPTNGTEGNLQVLVDGKWRFWDQRFTVSKTWVACRELGFIRPFNYYMKNNLTQVVGNVFTNEGITCTRKEERLRDCQHGSWTPSNKTKDFNLVWVVCEPNPPAVTCDPSPIKLEPYQYSHSGKVEINFKGKWEILHVKYWSEELGQQVCSQLGYPGLMKNLRVHEYLNENDYDNFRCEIIQKKLVCCPTTQKDRNEYPSIPQVALACEQDVRIGHSDALEIFRGKSWLQVCGETWSLQNTKVVCWDLGYSRKSKVSYYLTPAKESAKIWRNDIECNGKEDGVRACRSKYRSSPKCTHLVHVQCQGKEIRLSGFPRVSHAGRIEVLRKGMWGTVNDKTNSLSLSKARMTCQQLGYHDAFRALNLYEVPTVSRGLIWAKGINCSGNELHLRDCHWLQYDKGFNTHDYDVGVICKLNIRLVGSSRENEGKLEVYHNNSWKHICRRQWTLTEANVVCHELGYSNAVHYKSLLANYLNTSTDAYLRRRIRCSGVEKKLSECIHSEDNDTFCEDGAAEVRCEGNEGDVRLTMATHRPKCCREILVNRVDIMHQGIWGHVAVENWTMDNAQVVCRQLNKPGVKHFQLYKRVKRDDMVGSENTVIWLNSIRCKGNEKRLLDCPRSDWLRWKNESVYDWRIILECKRELRLRDGRTADEGLIDHYVNGGWTTVCDHGKRLMNITEYCQGMGYADGMEVANAGQTVKRKASSCKVGGALYIQCYAQQFRLENNGGMSYSGVVQVLHKNKWFKIFSKRLTHEDTVKMCNILGYPGFLRLWDHTMNRRQLVTDYLWWNGTKIVPSTLIVRQTLVAGLTCEKAIRLTNEKDEDGNNNVYYGIVEVYREKKWWRLSDNKWNKTEANVVCRYLGYHRASEAFTKTLPMRNTTILSVDYTCHGDEGDLTDCTQKEQKKNVSGYTRFSGVRCKVDGEKLCKACDCESRQQTVNCYGRRLKWMPWVPADYTTENVKTYLLGKNGISEVNKFHLREFTYIEKLDLSNNKISQVPEDLFSYTKQLRYLDLSDNLISRIPPNLFAHTPKLRYLNLSGNHIESLTSEITKNLQHLTVLDISRNKIRHFDEKLLLNVWNLKSLYTDRFTHCCHAKKIHPRINCSAPADVFSSCDELLKNDFLEVFVWIVAILVACGNLGVIFVRYNIDTHGLQTLFINSLVFSDILMSVYLLIIAYKNVSYKGRYFEHDEKWRSSESCTVAGVMSLLSSQISLFMITAITTERYFSIVNMSNKFRKFGSALSTCIVMFAWLFGGAIAIFPAVFPRYFNSHYSTFYGQNSVCLPLQLPEENREVFGWEYCLALFGGVNAVLCVYVTVCYVRMYVSLKHNAIRNNTVRKREDSYLAKRMLGIVITNLCCWIPVILFTFLSLRGWTSRVKTLHAWSAVCLFPINAALNPVIYTFFVPSVKGKLKKFLKMKDLQETNV